MDIRLLPNAGQNIITRQLPKTGQTTLYENGDDGDHEAGWWRGRDNANNRVRFFERTIGGDDIVLDRATGLMWPKDFQGNGANGGGLLRWASSINWTRAICTCAGFTDWRLPNALELLSIIHFETGPPYIWPPFINCRWTPDGYYWTSTTYPSATTQALCVFFEFPVLSPRTKTLSSYLVAVRKGL